MLVAAEASGDDRGAGLAKALKRRLGDQVRLVGIGGARMAEEGIASPFDISDISILGLWDALLAYPRIKRRVADTATLAAREKPDVAVLIDSWGFTLRVAHALRRLVPKPVLVKYVGPQVWATRPGRAKVLARSVDHLLTIHSFDAPLFEAEGLKTTFVGNGALSVDFSKADPAALRAGLGIGPDAPVLLVLPGSRNSEIKHVLPPFEDAIARLKVERPELEVIIPAAPTVATQVKAQAAGWPFRVHVVEGDEAKYAAMKAATVAMACSGTVTLELALAGCPMVVGYRFDRLTHFILKQLIRTPYVVLFNIAAQRFIAPELIQDDCNGPRLAREIALRLDDEAFRARQVAEQFEALDKMGRGGPDPSDAAADAILSLVSSRAN
jgi:lipid-A-disaccharide synthase